MKRARYVAYVATVLVFAYLFTKLLGVVSAPDDTGVFLGLGGMLGLMYLGYEFVRFVFQREVKGETN